MKKIPIITRILIVASAIWFIFWLVKGLMETHRGQATDLYYMAIIPLVLFWGIYWIIEGIKEKRKVRGK